MMISIGAFCAIMRLSCLVAFSHDAYILALPLVDEMWNCAPLFCIMTGISLENLPDAEDKLNLPPEISVIVILPDDEFSST